MKNFKSFITEAPTNASPDAEDRVRERQRREKEAAKIRQNREIERAKEQDFRKKTADRKAKEIQKNVERLGKSEDVNLSADLQDVEAVNEYLEDGTDELVKSYKKCLPGQE